MIIDKETTIKIVDYMTKNTKESVPDKCKKLNISVATYYRARKTHGITNKTKFNKDHALNVISSFESQCVS